MVPAIIGIPPIAAARLGTGGKIPDAAAQAEHDGVSAAGIEVAGFVLRDVATPIVGHFGVSVAKCEADKGGRKGDPVQRRLQSKRIARVGTVPIMSSRIFDDNAKR